MEYKILRIYEVYHWSETTQYDSTSKSGGLFPDYINMFLKIKQQASGWPSKIDRDQYMHDSYENEGINFNPDDIEVNPASLAKLNSLWGKFGQTMNKNHHKYFSANEVDTFYQLIYYINMHNFHILDDNTICMEWYHATENVPNCTSSNIFLATMTTCWACLRLYNILELVGDRALYYDTDSVIYVDKPGHPAPPIGPHLGQLKSELKSIRIHQIFC